MIHRQCFLLATVVTPILVGCAAPATKPIEMETIICAPQDASFGEELAAREVRRYLYLRTGRTTPACQINDSLPKGELLVIARRDRTIVSMLAAEAAMNSQVGALGPQQFMLKTIIRANRPVHLIVGGDDAGTLYAAYRYGEHLGVRFYLHGDVIPDERTGLELPALDEVRKPLFGLRGIQPFHDFPEGPDWWNLDDYKAIISQLPKLGMNFIGLHTYPENRPAAEPTVWIGLPRDIGDSGRVSFSYPSIYYNTALEVGWGFKPKRTGDYSLGAADLYDRDAYSSEVLAGLTPKPVTPEQCNEVFNRAGAMVRAAFEHAHRLGVRTCVGTETPLVVPAKVQERLKGLGKDPRSLAAVQELYEGMFLRITKAYPLDYYWFWTPEGWTWEGAKEEQIKATIDDIKAAYAAARKVGAPFRLGTCGWVLGPPNDRALFDKVLPKDMFTSCISRQVGHAPIEPGFARVQGRDKWAIPWLEDDPAMTSPQLWVGRMRKDAADSLRYGCDGLMGIHWRTRIIGPNVSALAQAAWDQKVYLTHPTTVPQNPPTQDFYLDWAGHQFGPGAGPQAARVFEKVDGKLPRPSDWVNGPGGIKPDARPWDTVKKQYAFVDDLAALRPSVKGAGNLTRFDYWLDTFRYLRANGRVNCTWARYNAAMERVKKEKDANRQRQLAREAALPIRKELVAAVAEVYRYLLPTVDRTGAMGTVTNWEQHIMPGLLAAPGEELAKVLGEPLPPDAQLSKTYEGPTRVFLPTVRTSVTAGEPLVLKAIVLSGQPVVSVDLHWRTFEDKRETRGFTRTPMTNVARKTFTATLPADATKGWMIEYYISAAMQDGRGVCFPETAPQLNQTVVTMPAEKG
jgi:hypothetical protein